MRIVHVNTERGFSGGEVQVFLLMEGLRRRGVDQLLVVPPGSAASRAARQRGFAVHELPMRHNLDLWSVVRLSGVLRGASIAHLHTGRAAWLGSLAAALVGIPRVVTRRMDRKVRRGLRTRFVYGDGARAIVAISSAVARLIAKGGVDPARIQVIPSAMDEDRIRVVAGREATRRSLQLVQGHSVLLVTASLMHRKGIDVLIRAVAELEEPMVVLLVAGEGPERPALEVLAMQLGVADQVKFLGQRNDPGDLLAACDVFVLPSRAEGLGNAAMEALGAQRPVVATRVGGLGELVVDGECGLLVDPEDVSGLAGALRRLLRDPELATRLSAGGTKRLNQGFRPDQMVEAYHRIYERIRSDMVEIPSVHA